MSEQTLDKKIFDEFVANVSSKRILSDDNINELRTYINKHKVSAEDWKLLVDKECSPHNKGIKDGN